MSEIDAVLETYAAGQRSIAQRLRELIHEEADGAEEAVKWGKPTLIVGGANLFYLDRTRDHVKSGLFAGADLPDPEGIVEGTGKKRCHVKIRSAGDIDEEAIRGLIREGEKVIQTPSPAPS